MKKRIVKYLGVFLAAVISLASMPMAVFATSPADFDYEIFEGEAVIYKYNGNETNVTIPGVIEGCPVVAIMPEAFLQNERLQAVTVPYNVQYIGVGAFAGCVNLQDVNLPDTLIAIDAMAFLQCVSLDKIQIPDSVGIVGGMAFAGCSFKEISLPSNLEYIDGMAFIYCNNLESITVRPVNNYYSSSDGVLFSYKKDKLVIFPKGRGGEYTVPNTVQSIEMAAFAGNEKLNSVVVSENVTTIGEVAFAGCINLQSVTIPANVTSIMPGAFEECTALTIYGEEGSAAQKYAKDNHIAFEKIKEIPARIELVQLPAKQVYTWGEELDLTGMQIRAYYKDQSIIVPIEECSVTGYDILPGQKLITIGFEKQYLRFTVTVEGAEQVKKGDVNNDGEVNIKDALMALQISVNLFEDSAEVQAASDINADSNTTIVDALRILQYSVGLLSEL